MISDSSSAPILVLGATTACGQFLLDRLKDQGVRLLAVSRRPPAQADSHVIWLEQDLDQGAVSIEASVLVSTGPLIHAIQQLEETPRLGRIVAMSSASTEFKAQSDDPEERALIEGLIDQERRLQALCRQRGVALTLLKPTMIYGGSRNANVRRIAALSERLAWIPYCGRGLRQPVHADDLARLVVRCLGQGEASAGTWLVGGGEALDYPAMLARVCSANGRRPRLIRLPSWLMESVLTVAHSLGRLGDIKAVMLKRQAMDLIVDDSPAREHLDWNPRPFRP
jgi:nucleoside-diphosphate-sugar epimerase